MNEMDGSSPPRRFHSPAKQGQNARSQQHSPPRLNRNQRSPSHPYSDARSRLRPRIKSPTSPLFSPRDKEAEEYEEKMKVRRLARFKDELKNDVEPVAQDAMPTTSPLRREPTEDSMEVDDLGPILGTCPDMCPESERGERERKGDLDKYERVDGDRNLTHKSLAVKKYNRVAERDSSLIRPLPVLQKTIDHLLNIINCSYVENFLNMHNFLWDRMRAIRMDLRMQHIFDKEAIKMYEQMIRFHIVAMHELCEYTKGENFSEGFDAHLNIEQMNKTSVELFQMYDDHRKSGHPIAAESEFRGYYALLKLDKHPGYRVETAELSLDLAKMTSEVRNTPEVLFAREVARASRSGNFIAFFRLARKATFLQACLMHAHFSKLRTQALASLYSGLQKNQGIPIAQVVKWLGMEGEDIESLLEYHGFTLRQYEALYMVKEGPFLNADTDFPTKRSKLVDQKRSSKVVADVISPATVPIMELKKPSIKAVDDVKQKVISQTHSEYRKASKVINKVVDNKEIKSGSDNEKFKPFQIPYDFGVHPISDSGIGQLVAEVETVNKPISLEMTKSFDNYQQDKVAHTITSVPEVWNNQSVFIAKPPHKNDEIRTSEKDENEKISVGRAEENILDKSVETQDDILVHVDSEKEKERLSLYRADAKRAEIRFLSRKWKSWASEKAKKKILSDKKKAEAAISSLTIGTSYTSKEISSFAAMVPVFSMGKVVRERLKRQRIMFSVLDLPEIVTPILVQKNPNLHCVCWKLVICSQDVDSAEESSQCSLKSFANSLLHRKLMGHFESEVENYSQDLTFFKRWVPPQNEPDNNNNYMLYLYILRDVVHNDHSFERKDARFIGAGGIIYSLLHHFDWELEKTKLQSLVRSIQPGAFIPLLIVTFGHIETTTIEKMLELQKLDRSRISNWSVISFGEEKQDAADCFSDNNLQEGLLWIAHHTPPQPRPCPCSIGDLVSESLSHFLKVLLRLKPLDVSPTDCIESFNRALEITENDIISAARNSIPGWPPAELDYFEDSMEKKVVGSCLPRSGWNSDMSIGSIINALRSCKLLQFPDINLHPIPFQNALQNSGSGSRFFEDILTQSTSLFSSLCKYLSCLGLGREDEDLVRLEADTLIQKNTTIELQNSQYLIAPKWACIFQRIYNWRMTILAGEANLIAYVSLPRSIPKVELIGRLSPAQQMFMDYSCPPPHDPTFKEMLEALYRSISRGCKRHSFSDEANWHKRQFNKQPVENLLGKCSEASLTNVENSARAGVSHLVEASRQFSDLHIDDDIGQQRIIRDLGKTDTEIQLDNMVSMFCEQVDDQSRRVALTLQGVENRDVQSKGTLETSANALIAAVPTSIVPMKQNKVLSFDSSFQLSVSKSPMAADGGLENFDSLFQQCLAVQSSLDKKLANFVGHTS